MQKSVAIVTGASQGIGQATAIRLARDFSALVLVARNRAKLEETAAAVKGRRRRSAGHRRRPRRACGGAERSSIRRLAAFGRIDALLNIAGAVPQIDLFEMTDAQWDAGLALKLHGARRLTIAAWPALKAAKGAVVLMSGNSALFPEGALCRRRHDQRRDRGAWRRLLRSRHRRRRPGQQRAARPGDDRPPPLLSRALGAAARHDGRGGDGQLPQGSRHRALRRAGGDRRVDGFLVRRARAG